MSTAASTASWRAGTVGTGERAILRTGCCNDTAPSATAARTSASVTIPSSCSESTTSSSEVAPSPSRRAASRRGASPSQNDAGRMISETGVVPRSRSPCTVAPVPVRRFRIVAAT